MKRNRMVASVALAGLILSLIVSGDAFSETPAKKASPSPCCDGTVVAKGKTKIPAVPDHASFKSLVAKAPEDVRMKFLESMMFHNGKLATARIKEIKESLGKKKYQSMLLSLGDGEDHEGYRCDGYGSCFASDGYLCNTEVCGGCSNGLGVGLGSTGVFADLLPAERKKFLESLDFVDGHLVSAYIADAHKKMSAPNFKKLFTALGVKPEEVTSKAKDGLFKVKHANKSSAADKTAGTAVIESRLARADRPGKE